MDQDLERRVRELEAESIRTGQRLGGLEEASARCLRLLETLREAMTDLSYRAGSLERWRTRDEPRIQASYEQDELAARLAAMMQEQSHRRLSTRDRILAWAVGGVGLAALVTQVAELFQ